jgi:biotin operon repressor
MAKQVTRMQRMMAALRTPRDVDSLSREFGQCTKTIRRDLVNLKRLGIPIEIQRRRHGRHLYSMSETMTKTAYKHHQLRPWNDPPRGLEARTLTLCLRPDQWAKIEWLADHLRHEAERTVSHLTGVALAEVDVEEVMGTLATNALEEKMCKYPKY